MTVPEETGAVARFGFGPSMFASLLDGKVPVWPFDFAQDRPFDPLHGGGSAVVEIYTRAFIRLAGLAGRKVRSLDLLNRALAALGSAPAAPGRCPNDHETDAIVAAAGLRAIADDAGAWNPAGLTARIARTEGWTFGVR